MRKYKKSTWLPVALFIYTTIMAVFLFRGIRRLVMQKNMSL